MPGRATILGDVLAMNDDDEATAQPTQADPSRTEVAREELKDLSRLNNAMYRWVYSDNLATTSFLAAMWDMTDPSKDKCEVSRSRDMTIQGDFYFLQRVGRLTYIIVGDAAGHDAYAGGLKIFIAAALKEVFERASWFWALTAEEVLQELRTRFLAVGKAALQDHEQLYGGATMVVVRIDRRLRATTYASAGLPVFTISSAGEFKCFGKYSDIEGISFPESLQSTSDLKPDAGTVPTEGVDFLAFVTDGFRSLQRLACCGAEVPGPFFGQDGVENALVSASLDAVGKDRPDPQQVAERLVHAARKFREGYMIPDSRDDDRLVVVVDVERAVTEPPDPGRSAWWRSMTHLLSWESSSAPTTTTLRRIVEIVVPLARSRMTSWLSASRYLDTILELGKRCQRSVVPKQARSAMGNGGEPAG
jgi:Stage II sporulation protein E (SpoIIE)